MQAIVDTDVKRETEQKKSLQHQLGKFASQTVSLRYRVNLLTLPHSIDISFPTRLASLNG